MEDMQKLDGRHMVDGSCSNLLVWVLARVSWARALWAAARRCSREPCWRLKRDEMKA